jgi:hypothetical protein
MRDLRFITAVKIHVEVFWFAMPCGVASQPTAQLRPPPPPQNPAEFLGGFSTIFFFTG